MMGETIFNPPPRNNADSGIQGLVGNRLSSFTDHGDGKISLEFESGTGLEFRIGIGGELLVHIPKAN